MQIQLFFGWDQKMAAKGIEAASKIDGIRHTFPQDLRRIMVFTGSMSDEPVLELRISSERDLSTSFELLDRLVKRRIERLDGVSRVELQGVEPREIRILLRSDDLAAYGIDIPTLRDLLIRSNFAVSAGRLTDNDQRFSVRPRGEFQSVEAIRNLAINDRGLRLGDVADVDLRMPDRNYGRHLDQSYAIGVAVNRSTGSNLVDVTDRVIAEVQEIGKLPQMQGIKIIPLDNQGDLVRKSLYALFEAGLLGCAAGSRRSVPVPPPVDDDVDRHLVHSVLAPDHARGAVLRRTDAEHTFDDGTDAGGGHAGRQRRRGHREHLQASVRRAGQAVRGHARRRARGRTRSDRGHRDDGHRIRTNHLRRQDRHHGVPHARGGDHHRGAGRFPAHRSDAGTNAGRPGAVAAAAAGRLTDESAHEVLRVRPALGDRASLANGGRHRPRLSRRRRADGTRAGEGRHVAAGCYAAAYLPYHIEGQHPLETVEQPSGASRATCSKTRSNSTCAPCTRTTTRVAVSTLLLNEDDALTVPTPEVIERILEKLPTIAIGKPSFQWDQQGGGEGFSLQLSGDSTAVLNELGAEIARRSPNVDGLRDVKSDAESGDREVQVLIDRDRAALAGLTAADISQAVSIAMRGENLREFRGDVGEVAVRLAFRENDRQTIEQLADLPLYAPDGRRVPLGSVASLHVARSPDAIKRTDRQTAVILSGNLEKDTALEDVRPAVSGMMEQIELPPGYSWKFGRGFEREDETQSTMMVNLVLGIACIFLVMAALFESLILPFSIILGSILFFHFRRVPVLRGDRHHVFLHGDDRHHDPHRCRREQRHRTRRSRKQYAQPRLAANRGNCNCGPGPTAADPDDGPRRCWLDTAGTRQRSGRRARWAALLSYGAGDHWRAGVLHRRIFAGGAVDVRLAGQRRAVGAAARCTWRSESRAFRKLGRPYCISA